MSVEIDPDVRIPRLDIELTPACDHKCGHCYNVWTAVDGDPQAGYETRGQLPTPAFMALIEKAVEQSGARHITITGGEPLLRRDALEIIAFCGELVDTLTVITNGSHVTPEVAATLRRAGVSQVQLTLLSHVRARHDRLKGAECFDDTVRAAVDLRAAGVPVQACFVAMRENATDFADVLELCLALGIGGVSYNRMSPTGGAIHHIARLMPTVEQIRDNLDTAERLGPGFGIHVSTAMPIPPCLIPNEHYRWVRFGYCSTGTDSPNIVLDAAGNVRSCNLAGGVMGNLQRQDWAEVYRVPYQREFKRNLPAMCQGCRHAPTCQGGCKESAFATFGDHTHPEPLLWLAQDEARRDALAGAVVQFDVPAIRLRRAAP
jgi:radical SAM protein with 4Fe4S-binding SPASM domain